MAMAEIPNFQNTTLSVNTALAREIGLNESIVLLQLHHLISVSGH